MKKIFITYWDNSKLTYTLKNDTDEKEYLDRHKNSFLIKTMIFQQYPKKDNEPIVYIEATEERKNKFERLYKLVGELVENNFTEEEKTIKVKELGDLLEYQCIKED